MAETAKNKPNSIDSPAQEGGHKGNANSLPTKTWPSSTKMATAGKSNTIEGPCSEAVGKGLYHK